MFCPLKPFCDLCYGQFSTPIFWCPHGLWIPFLVNVIAQIFLTDAFLGGEFSKFGTQVLHFHNMEPEDRVDPMSRVFPRMTKCIFYKYGGSGTIQRIDSLCVLSMNIINEKVYIFLWFWFILLAVITAISLATRIVSFFVPDFRQR